MKGELLPCPVCGKQPRRNGRLGVGGVLCADGTHRVQVYGKIQEDADRAWNASACAATITDLTAQLDKAREALRPFARILDVVGDDPNEPDDADAFSRLADHPLNLGHLRAARACLPATSGDVG